MQASSHLITIAQQHRANDGRVSQLDAWKCKSCNLVDRVVQEGKLKELLCVVGRQDCSISRNDAYYLLQECTRRKDLEAGRQIQSLMVRTMLNSVSVLGDHLVKHFVCCGNLLEAQQAFDKIQQPTLYSWNLIMSGHAKLGQSQVALHLYDRMQLVSMEGNKYIYLTVLKACVQTATLCHGRLVHMHISISNSDSDVTLQNVLICMYVRCGSLDEATKVFDGLQNRDVISWNAIITGYADYGKSCSAIECFESLKVSAVKPDQITFLGVLKACSKNGAIALGRHIHEMIIQRQLQTDVSIGSTLVDMYVKCGNLEEAHKIFETLPGRNFVSWGAMISGYSKHGKCKLALEYFNKMQQERIRPDSFTFSSVLKACGALGAIQQGRRLHMEVIGSGFEGNLVVANALLSMYVKCGSLGEAHKVFEGIHNRDVISWTSMIAGYAKNGEGFSALHCFYIMQCEGVMPNKATFLGALKGCSSLPRIEQGRHIHALILQHQLQLDTFVGSTLVDMYAKVGKLEEACKAFVELPNRNVVSWDALVAGFIQSDRFLLALECYDLMQVEGINLEEVTVINMMKACGSIGAIDQGRNIHKQISENVFHHSASIGNAIVDMYAKCGSLDEAREVFKWLPDRDIVSWNIMIGGYCRTGDIGLAMDCFEVMKYSGVKPDGVTFVNILSSLSSAGFMGEIHLLFNLMRNCYDILPDASHYNCMIDIMGHAGCFKEAEEILQATRRPNICGWISLFGACKVHGNLKLGKQCFEEIVALDPGNAAAYVLMSNVYVHGHLAKGT